MCYWLHKTKLKTVRGRPDLFHCIIRDLELCEDITMCVIGCLRTS